MNPAAAAILEGMPDPRDLRGDEHDGVTFICAGSALLACYCTTKNAPLLARLAHASRARDKVSC